MATVRLEVHLAKLSSPNAVALRPMIVRLGLRLLRIFQVLVSCSARFVFPPHSRTSKSSRRIRAFSGPSKSSLILHRRRGSARPSPGRHALRFPGTRPLSIRPS
jgi:hypothetical protein